MERDYYGLKSNEAFMVDPKKKVKVVKSSEKKRETLPMKHGCVSGFGWGCGTQQFLKK